MDNVKHIIWDCMIEAIVLGKSDELVRWIKVIRYIPIEFIPQQSSTSTLSHLLPSAVYANQPEIVKVLLEKGIRVNHIDEEGNTLFSIAVQLGAQEIAKMLLSQSKDIFNHPNFSGWTPLHFAAITQNYSISNWLLQQGTNPYQVTNNHISGMAILCKSLTSEACASINIAKQKIDSKKACISRKQAEVMQKNSANRINLLNRFTHIGHVLYQYPRASDAQQLLYEILALTYFPSHPVEWIEILSAFVIYLLQHGAEIDNKSLYLIIMSGAPILDVLLEKAPGSHFAIKKLYDKLNYNCLLDATLENLQRFVLHEGFTCSKSYEWYVTTIAQLMQIPDIKLNQTPWDVTDGIYQLRDEHTLQLSGQPNLDTMPFKVDAANPWPTPPDSSIGSAQTVFYTEEDWVASASQYRPF